MACTSEALASLPSVTSKLSRRVNVWAAAETPATIRIATRNKVTFLLLNLKLIISNLLTAVDGLWFRFDPGGISVWSAMKRAGTERLSQRVERNTKDESFHEGGVSGWKATVGDLDRAGLTFSSRLPGDKRRWGNTTRRG